MTAVIDTSVLFAQAVQNDQYHETARDIFSGVDHADLPPIHIPEYVVAESMNLLMQKVDHRGATAVLDRLSEGSQFELRHTTKSDLITTQALFRRYSRLSFVDASIVAYMQRTGIEYLYSFDDDFDDLEEITRLNAAVDPRE